jgi:endoglucanase
MVVTAMLAKSCPAAEAQPENWPLWERYTARFVEQQGRVVDHDQDDRTTSEGQSYALFFALVDNDRARFDKLLTWTQDNLAAGDLSQRLPAWRWGKAPDGSWKVLDPNSASDSDIWIAYSLLEAGRLWHDKHYEMLGRALAARIAQEELVAVPGLGTTLIAGSRGFHPDAKTWVLNPSYFPLPVLMRLESVMPRGPWKAVLTSLHPLFAKGCGAGYAMDWVVADGGGVHPSMTPAQLATGKKDAGVAVGSYDAIRVYLWLGMADTRTPGRSDLVDRLSGMANYMKNQKVPPERVDLTGKILDANGPVGFSAALVPFLLARDEKAEAVIQMDRVNAQKDATTGLYGSDAAHPRYYDQNLVLFATGWSEERFRFEKDGKLKVKWK